MTKNTPNDMKPTATQQPKSINLEQFSTIESMMEEVSNSNNISK